MSERIFLRLGEACAIGADDLQWIIYRGSRKANGETQWSSVGFVRSSKEVLLRVIRTKCGDVPGLSALDGLPDTFDAWKGAQNSPQALVDGIPTKMEAASEVGEAA